MRMGKTEPGLNSSHWAFSAAKGPLSDQNYVPSHGKGHFSENDQKKGHSCGIKRRLWCLYAGSYFLFQHRIY